MLVRRMPKWRFVARGGCRRMAAEGSGEAVRGGGAAAEQRSTASRAPRPKIGPRPSPLQPSTARWACSLVLCRSAYGPPLVCCWAEQHKTVMLPFYLFEPNSTIFFLFYLHLQELNLLRSTYVL